MGLFGKLPARGDFVARGDPAIVTRIERWLIAELGKLSAAKGVQFDRLLAGAPVWRFTLRHGHAVLACAMIPSADRHGRLFPLILFAESTLGQALAHADALATAPLDRETTADAVLAVIATIVANRDGDAVPPDRDIWRNDAGDLLLVEGLPTGADFIRLFDMATLPA